MIEPGGFGIEPGDLVSFVGGGGKTSAMLALARGESEQGRVMVTTTTKIWPPDLPTYIGGELPSGERLFAAAERRLPDGKLGGFSPERVDEIWRAGGLTIFCEADGSMGRPLKGWARHEPPVPSMTTVLVAVVACDVLGAPITRDSTHRSEILSERFGVSEGDLLTPRLLSEMLESDAAYLKNAPRSARRVLYLSRADRLDRDSLRRVEHDFVPALRAPSWGDVIIGSAVSENESEG